MIKRIILENYMSHARTVIEPAEGLTVLVGPNNCGKSAVVSALQTLCGDNAGDFMVRHGQRVCQVTVETDDGHAITWRRKGAAVMYVIDGREIHRSGRGNLPDDLHEHLRLPKVEASGSDDAFDVHFALQKSPIFLIDNEGKAAKFFSTSSDAERLLEVQKLHKSNVSDARTKQKLLAGELARLDELLQSLAPIDGINDSLNAAERTFERLAAEGEEIAARSKLNDSIGRCERQVGDHRRRCAALRPLAPPPQLADTDRLERACAAIDRVEREIARRCEESTTLSDLPAPPNMADADGLESAIVLLQGLNQSVEGIRQRCRALERLDGPPALRDDQPLSRLCSRLADAHEWTRRNRSTGEALTALEDPPEIVPTASFESFLKRLVQLEGSVRTARRRAGAAVELKPPPSLADLAPLEQLIQRRTTAEAQVARLRGSLEQFNTGLAEVATQVRQWSQSHPTCPLCGAATDADLILAGGHVHD